MRSVAILSVLFFLIIGISGCATVEKDTYGSTGDLQASQKMRFADVPFPAGFKVDSGKSFVLESGGMRAGKLRYIGKSDPSNVVMFYRNQMPNYNWSLLNILEYEDKMLNFEREKESCVVEIKSRGDRVEISISLAPKSPIIVAQKDLKKSEVKAIEVKDDDIKDSELRDKFKKILIK